MPREVLSHVLVLEGRDWAAAEVAVREVLARQPNNPTAKINHSVVLRQREARPARPTTIKPRRGAARSSLVDVQSSDGAA